MKKKHLVKTLLIISIIIAVFIAIDISLDFYKENKIRKEVVEIINYLNNENYKSTDIDTILNRHLIKKGPYHNVENCIKKYYKDFINEKQNIDFLISDDNYINYLSGENLKEDNLSFIHSKENLNNTKLQIKDTYKKMKNKVNDQKEKLTYIGNQKIKSYYKNFYLTLIDDYIDKEYLKKIEIKKDIALKNIDVYLEIFDYLNANRSNWKIRNNALEFNDTIYSEEYNNLLSKLIKETPKLK